MKKKKRGFKHHIKHKSKLSLFLITKILLLVVCFMVGILIVTSLESIINEIVALIIGFTFMILLYLFLVIKILPLFKF